MAVATVLTNAGLRIITNRIKGSGTEPAFFAIGTGGTTAAVTDTALGTEVSGVRAASTVTTAQVTTTNTNDTYRSICSYTVVTPATYSEVGLFDAASAGNMFVSATIAPITVIAGDTVQFTIKVKFAN